MMVLKDCNNRVISFDGIGIRWGFLLFCSWFYYQTYTFFISFIIAIPAVTSLIFRKGSFKNSNSLEVDGSFRLTMLQIESNCFANANEMTLKRNWIHYVLPIVVPALTFLSICARPAQSKEETCFAETKEVSFVSLSLSTFELGGNAFTAAENVTISRNRLGWSFYVGMTTIDKIEFGDHAFPVCQQLELESLSMMKKLIFGSYSFAKLKQLSLKGSFMMSFVTRLPCCYYNWNEWACVNVSQRVGSGETSRFKDDCC